MAKEEKVTLPGENLKKVNPEAHAATYDENGDLRAKNHRPVAAVEGFSEGTAETHVSAKIQEPVTSEVVNPIDTVDDKLAKRKPETVEVTEGADSSLKTGDLSPNEPARADAQKRTIDALDVDKTEAAKNSKESQKEAKKNLDKDGNAYPSVEKPAAK